MIKVFISHSSAQKDFAQQLVELLGRDRCIIDCYDFESAYKTLDEIYSAIEESTVVAFLATKDSLSSEWCMKEVDYAYSHLKADQKQRLWPFVIDKEVTLDDMPNWMVKDEAYNIKYFKSPKLLARDIEQKNRKIIWDKNPLIKDKETALVGRNEEINIFEEKILSSNYQKIRALFISGREGVGKASFAKKCMRKNGYPEELEPFKLSLGIKESIEDFIIGLNLITENYNSQELEEIFQKEPKEKSKAAVKILNTLYDNRSVLLVDDNMAMILPNRNIPDWVSDILTNEDLNPQLGLYVLSKITPTAYIETRIPQIVHISLKPLNRADRKKLFYKFAIINDLKISDKDADFFVDRLLQSPEQIINSIMAIKKNGLTLAKNDIEELIKIGDSKIRPIIELFSEEEERHLLIVLSRFDFLSFEVLEGIYEERYHEILQVIQKMLFHGVANTFGPSDIFIRLDYSLSDYIRRNKFIIPEDLENHVTGVLEDKIASSNDITQDASVYMYNIKRRIIEGKSNNDNSLFLIPSIVIKSIMDLYNKMEYNDVVEICENILKNSTRFYRDVEREIIYWLCLALCRLKDIDKFKNYVNDIEGADKDFLRGFSYRNTDNYEEAEHFYKQALKKQPSMQRAKRELVTVMLAQRKYEEALEMAAYNFNHNPENTYHAHAYFRCLVKKKKIKNEDLQVLEEIMGIVQNSFSDKKEELYAAMEIEFHAYALRDSPSKILQLINKAQKDFPKSLNIKRAAHEYKLKQEMIIKDLSFSEDFTY